MIHNKTNQIYSMKIVRKSKLQTNKDKEHICNEKKIQMNLEHPFLSPLLCAFQDERKLYLLTDYYSGGYLSYHIQDKGGFNEKDARLYFAQVVLVIEYLHKKNIIFRALSPEAILLDKKGSIKLCDFSLVKDNIDGSHKGTRTFCGTPEYMAPEIIQKRSYGKCVDIWCMGILLYEMLFGYAPFIDDDITTLYQKIIFNEVKFNNKDLDANTQDLIRQLLNKNHQKRIQIREVKNHPFFIGINFEDIEKDEDNILMPVRPLENEDMYIEPELFQQNTHNNSNSSLSTLMFPTIDEFNEPSSTWDII